MSDSNAWFVLAYHAERVAARRLARQCGLSQEQALRRTLEQTAGAKGLAALLTERSAQQTLTAERASARRQRQAEALARRQDRHTGVLTAWKAWFDGSAHPNPGRCGIGVLLTGPNEVRIEISQAAGYGDSSDAEYRALLAVLGAAASAGASDLTVYGDSQVVINDVTGDTGKPAASLAAYRAAARGLMERLPGVCLRWIPRHKNAAADALSQQAVRSHAAGQPE